MNPRQIAHIVHEAHRAHQIEHAADQVSGHWHEISESTRQTVIEGVVGVLAGDTPAQSHERWRKRKRSQGWVWGPKKDEYKRTHPCMVPYNRLLEHEQVKDRLFVAMVQVLAESKTEEE